MVGAVIIYPHMPLRLRFPTNPQALLQATNKHNLIGKQNELFVNCNNPKPVNLVGMSFYGNSRVVLDSFLINIKVDRTAVNIFYC